MSLPSYGKTARFSKFGEKTRSFSVRLPCSVVDKIKEERIDIGTIIYNAFIGKNNPKNDNPVVNSLLHKLVKLMIDKGVDATDVHFEPAEHELVMKIRDEVM